MIDKRQVAGEGQSGFSLKYDRGTMLTGGLLILVAVLAWISVLAQSAGMQGVPGMKMSMGGESLLASALAYLVAWGVMMTAMMLPSAAIMISLYGILYRNSLQIGARSISTALFALIYLLVWLAFGVPVYAASLVLSMVIMAHPAIVGILPYAFAGTLLAAGAFQFSPLKKACMQACQHPLIFLMGHWRSGYRGTFRMALEHAAYCIGCCWALMIILVVTGTMALHWMLLIAVVVFAEKLPYGEWTARIVGAGFLLLGLFVLIQPGFASILQGW